MSLGKLRRILVTGASGFVGEYVACQLTAIGYDVYSVYKNNMPAFGKPICFDLTSSTSKLFNIVSPDIIVHLAAMTNVDQCEMNQADCERINVLSTLEICKTAVPVVMISTDYVFSGAVGHYYETDPVDPVNYYGKSKAEAEKIVLANPESCVLRISSPFAVTKAKPLFYLQVFENLLNGKKVSVVGDQYSTPTYVPTLASAVAEVIERNLTGIFNIAVDRCSSKYQFIKDCSLAVGLDTSLISESSVKEISWKAKRPLNSCLNVQKAKSAFETIDLNYSSSIARFATTVKNTFGIK